MSCSEARLAANRANAARSTGPRTAEGKSRSRANATKHGLAAELLDADVDAEADASPEFQQRRARWAAEQHPVGEAGHWALDQAVAATFRIERCGHAIDGLIVATRERARLAWDQDRAVEAATLAGRLARDPVLVSRQLETTLAGVDLLIEAWLGLTAPLMAGADWSESEASKALDLLGVSPDGRSGRTPIDGPGGADPIAFHHELALGEVERLEALRDVAMVPLDELGRHHAMSGGMALLSRPVRLVLRYERDAWTRYNRAMKDLKAQAPSPVAAPARVEPPKFFERPASPSAEGRPRAEPAGAKPTRPLPTGGHARLAFATRDAWLADFQRRGNTIPDPQVRAILTAEEARPFATERTQSAGVAVGQGS